MYKPLPLCLSIGKSEIEGLGLLATMDIPKNYNLGITHVKDERFEDGFTRTPLGGFFNHSANNPNCKVLYKDDFIYLITIKEIKSGEELTATYTLYDPEK